jgi:TetR/AcrR family transcriptional repressor of bet genes|tara:strand:+ start:1169 stop:1903 length:735 start_codon:yes stop_codon:yes gene_type:complete
LTSHFSAVIPLKGPNLCDILKMQARSISSIRRSELSQAAFEAVIRYGLRGTTLEKVGEIAGVSKGVVLHHFKDKSALLEAVFRRSNSVLSMSLLRLYRHAESPYERFWAIAYANFSETIYNREVCQAWVSLLAEVPHNAMCQRVQAANNARIKSNLSHELRHFLEGDRVPEVANLLGTLIDGIWVRAGLFAITPDCEKALNEFEFTTLYLVGASLDEEKHHKDAREKIKTIAKIALSPELFRPQ